MSEVATASPEVLLAEVTFGEARGGRKGEPLAIEVVRPLGQDDLQALSGAVAAPTQRLLAIRHSHHALARLVTEGRDQAEISLISGYSPAYISTLQNDPAFAELVSYYAGQREQVFIDTLERLKSLGLSSAAELQQRLDEAPEKFSNREVMELVEMALIKPVAAQAKQQGPGGGAPVSVSISFVGAEPSAIDITPSGGR